MRAVIQGHEPLRVFHLWIAQLEAQGRSAAASEYIAPDEVEEDGPVRVLLGESGEARSRVRQAPVDVNCFHVRLKDRQHFRYAAPDGHDLIWLAVDRGCLQLQGGERVLWEQIAFFGDSGGVIDLQADSQTSFVLGSARGAPAGPLRRFSTSSTPQGTASTGEHTRLPRS